MSAAPSQFHYDWDIGFGLVSIIVLQFGHFFSSVDWATGNSPITHPPDFEVGGSGTAVFSGAAWKRSGAPQCGQY